MHPPRLDATSEAQDLTTSPSESIASTARAVCLGETSKLLKHLSDVLG